MGLRLQFVPGALTCAIALTVVACAPAEPTPTYATVKPFLDAKCGNCHRPNAIAPMSLLAYDEVLLFADDIRRVIDDGTMPPWLAEDACNTYKNDNRLTADEKKTLFAWLDAGAPAGDSDEEIAQALASEPGAAPVSVVRADLVLDAASEAYEPQYQDEYRCYAIAVPDAASGEQYITGFDVLPGDPTNVHHVNVFMNPPVRDAPDFLGLDDEDPLPGYDCSAERVVTTFLVGAWAPGASGLRYPAGTGQLIEPGSVMVLEVHYAVASRVPDLTQVVLELAPRVDRRGLGVAFWKFQDWERGGMEIPAGEASVTHSVDLDPALILAAIAPWITDPRLEIGLGGLHMHVLGTSGELSVLSPEGDSCLVQVNEWDFRWQFGYELQKPIEFFVGEDQLHLECTWNNTAEHQPYIDGVQQEVRDRNWGHRTSDEMCMGFLYLTEAR